MDFIILIRFFFLAQLSTGPLQNTINDFWQMVLNAQSTLIVMVTTIMERGRSKCAKYWPPVSETLEVGPTLRVRTTKEESDTSNSFVFREFELWDTTVRPATFFLFVLGPAAIDLRVVVFLERRLA